VHLSTKQFICATHNQRYKRNIRKSETHKIRMQNYESKTHSLTITSHRTTTHNRAVHDLPSTNREQNFRVVVFLLTPQVDLIDSPHLAVRRSPLHSSLTLGIRARLSSAAEKSSHDDISSSSSRVPVSKLLIYSSTALINCQPLTNCPGPTLRSKTGV